MRRVWILSKSWHRDSQKDVKSTLNSKWGKCSLNLAKTNFLIPAFFERLLNFLRFVSCNFLSSFSRWFLTLNNHFKSKLKSFISSQKLSIKRKSFLQCSCKSKSRHLLSISFTLFRHSSVNCSEGCPMQKLFFDTKPFGNSPNDLQISKNTMW